MIEENDVRMEDEFYDGDLEHDVLEHCGSPDVGQIETEEILSQQKYKSNSIVVGQKFPNYIKEQMAERTKRSKEKKRELRNGPSTKRSRMSNLQNQMATMARENECQFLCLLMSKNDVKYSSNIIVEGLFAKKFEERIEFRDMEKLWNSEMYKLQEARMLTNDWKEAKAKRDKDIKDFKKANRINSSQNSVPVNRTNHQDANCATASASIPTEDQDTCSPSASAGSCVLLQTTSENQSISISRTASRVQPVLLDNFTVTLPTSVGSTASKNLQVMPNTSSKKLPAPVSSTGQSVSPILPKNFNAKLPARPATASSATSTVPLVLQNNSTKQVAPFVNHTSTRVPPVPVNQSAFAVTPVLQGIPSLNLPLSPTAASPIPSSCPPLNADDTWIVIFRKEIDGTTVKMKFPKFHENRVGGLITINGEKYLCAAIQQKGSQQTAC